MGGKLLEIFRNFQWKKTTHTNHVENMGQHEIHGEIFGKHTVYVGVDFILLQLCWVGSVSQ